MTTDSPPGCSVDPNFPVDRLCVQGLPAGPTLDAPVYVDGTQKGVFLFGAADGAGRDLFVRTLYGARTSLYVGLAATFIEILLGVTFGIIAGFFRGKTDTAISRTCDIFFALPTLLLMLGISAACGAQPPGQECLGGLLKPGTSLIIVLIGFFSWPYLDAHHPRPGPVDPREGVHRGRPVARRVEHADHVPRRAAERPRGRSSSTRRC